MKIALLLNETIAATREAVREVRAAARRLGIAVLPEARAAEADVLLVLGGDGSMLRAVRTHGGDGVPFLGVNIGSLGYLTSTPLAGAEEALRALRDGETGLEERSMLRAQVRRGGNGRALAAWYAFNELVAMRSQTVRVVGIDLEVDGEDAASFLCDGLILATPSGSTAYSLSAGGPILLPQTPAFVVSVVCPHTLTSRPLVVPAESVVTVRVSRAQAPLSWAVDGQVAARLHTGDTFTATTAARKIRLVTLPGHNPFAPLRHKLGWSAAPLR